jgi:hypothetical protein
MVVQSSAQSCLLRKERKLTKIPSQEAYSLGSPLYPVLLELRTMQMVELKPAQPLMILQNRQVERDLDK